MEERIWLKKLEEEEVALEENEKARGRGRKRGDRGSRGILGRKEKEKRFRGRGWRLRGSRRGAMREKKRIKKIWKKWNENKESE